MQNGAIRRKNLITEKSKSIKPILPDYINDTLKYNFITPVSYTHLRAHET